MKFLKLCLSLTVLLLLLNEISLKPPTVRKIAQTLEQHHVQIDPDTNTVIAVSQDYKFKVHWIRKQIDSIYKDADPFIRESLILYAPRFILGCKERGFHTPGERFAQCILESSKLTKNGRQWSTLTVKYHNFGGVKAKKGFNKTPKLKTHEIVNGQRLAKQKYFLAADNKWQGIDYYLDVLKARRYSKAMNYTGQQHFSSLANSGYCTDNPQVYAKKCMRIYNMYSLSHLNGVLQNLPSNEP